MVRKHVLNIVSPQEPQTQTITRSHVTPVRASEPESANQTQCGRESGRWEPAWLAGASPGQRLCAGRCPPAGKGEPPTPAFTRAEQASPPLFTVPPNEPAPN